MEDRLFDPTPTLTVAELTQRIGVVIERAFEDEVWLRGEIQSLNPNRAAGGALYFDLVEPAGDGERAVARIGVILREDNRRAINVQLKRNRSLRMEDGLDVRIRGRLEFWRRSGRLSFRMTAIDPEYTLGRIASERERVLAALRDEGLLDRNGSLPLPDVPLRVALVTSAASAACRDFLHELEVSGFGWRVHLVDARMQGVEAGPSVSAALERALAVGADVVALVRGGGARTDLAALDGEAIARAIAGFPLPVLTGIGHEVDRSVADEVAHTGLKTPTACAAHLVARVRAFCERLDRGWNDVERAAGAGLARQDGLVDDRARRAVRGAQAALVAATRAIDTRVTHLARSPDMLARCSTHLEHLDARRRSLDPARALARGWSITRRPDGTVVRSSGDVVVGDELVTEVAQGTITSRVADG